MEFQMQTAIYLQIARQLTGRILAGEWPPGSRMPSVRDLAAEMQVNPNTAMRSFAYLQEEGLINNQRGIGFFVADQAISLAKTLRKNLFLRELLPQLVEQMTLLGISWEELQAYYLTFKQHASKQHDTGQ